MFKNIVSSFAYIFLNYFVCYIPVWHIRKLFYVILGMKMGKKSRICMGTVVRSPWKIKIGHNTIVNEYCYLDGRGNLEIGNNTSLSPYTIILSSSHLIKSKTFEYVENKTVVKDNVFIGTRCNVLSGSVLENLCVLCAGSTFKGQSTEKKVYSGNPAVEIKDRGLDEVYNLSCTMFFR